MTKTAEEASVLIANLTVSNVNACSEYDRKLKTTSTKDSSEINELKSMQQLLKISVDDQGLYDEDDDEGQEGVNFIRGQWNFHIGY
ncbi:unnamed protein product [Cochlearia groenlandica]